MRNLIISGAGTRGSALLGALSCLERDGHLADVRDVSGVSFGAMTATMWVAGLSFGDIMDETNTLNVKEMCSINIKNVVENLGMASTDRIMDRVTGVLSRKGVSAAMTFRELMYRSDKVLRVAAVSLGTRKLVYFDAYRTPDVRVLDAVRASISIPVLFSPCTIDGDMYVDGGAVRHIPYDPYVGHEADTMYVCVSIADITVPTVPTSLRGVIEATFDCVWRVTESVPPGFSNFIKVVPPNGKSGLDFSIKREDIMEMFESGRTAYAHWDMAPVETLLAQCTKIS